MQLQLCLGSGVRSLRKQIFESKLLAQGHTLAVKSPQITTKSVIKAQTLSPCHTSLLNFHCLRVPIFYQIS